MLDAERAAHEATRAELERVTEELTTHQSVELSNDLLRGDLDEARLEYSALHALNAQNFERANECQKDFDALKAHHEASRAKVARLREVLELARRTMQNDWYNKPRIGMERECGIVDAALADTAPDAPPAEPSKAIAEAKAQGAAEAVARCLDSLRSAAAGYNSPGLFGVSADGAAAAKALLKEIHHIEALADKTPPALLAPQPPPTRAANSVEVWPSLLAKYGAAMSPELRALCEARDAQGRAKYGVALMTHNGRDAATDALQETLDLLAYAHQAALETPRARALLAADWDEVIDDALDLADRVDQLASATKGGGQ